MGLMIVLALTLGAPALKDAKPAADLIGLWEHEQSLSGGKDVAQKRSAPLRYEFRKDGTYVIYEGDKEIVGPRDFKFDPHATPATLDTRINKPSDGEPAFSLAIYKIEADRLTICKIMPGKPRPTEFETRSGSANYIMIFRRLKKD
jgi:uncharacterized protein (TIGR03067 family)